MKISLRFFFVLLAATAVLTSCEKCGEVTISQPSAEDAEWLVYKQSARLQFVTETGETAVYTRSGIFAQSLPGEGFSATDECIDNVNIQIRTLMEDTLSIQPSLSTRILSKPDTLHVEVSVGEFGVWEINKQEPTYAMQEVNGRSYEDVYEVITASTEEGGVKRILYNKAYGILSVEFINGKLLQLIPS